MQKATKIWCGFARQIQTDPVGTADPRRPGRQGFDAPTLRSVRAMSYNTSLRMFSINS
jgi:hypothetical protein